MTQLTVTVRYAHRAASRPLGRTRKLRDKQSPPPGSRPDLPELGFRDSGARRLSALPTHVIECAKAGAHVGFMPFKVPDAFATFPHRKGLAAFFADWEKTNETSHSERL